VLCSGVRVELVFCVCCLCLFYGGGAAHLCTPPLPRLARFLRCLSLRRVPCSTSARHAGTPAPGQGKGRDTAVWARVLWPNQARRRSCFAASRPTRRLASYDLLGYLWRLRHSVGLSPLAAFERRVVKKHTKGFGGHKLVAAFMRILGF